MRSFTDGEGRQWDVTVGRESWGNLVLLFSPRRGNDNRTLLVAAETSRQAEAELAALSEEELRARLDGSTPWDPSA